VRVGSFSHLDQILPYNTLKKSEAPLPLPVASNPPRIGYRFDGQTYSLDDFLAHQRITGLLVVKDGQILAEHYQYDRTATDRLVSHSMAKSIVSLAIAMALTEGKIASLDDSVAKYAPKLAFDAGVHHGLARIQHARGRAGHGLHYASNQTVALTLVLRAATGSSLSDYLTPRLWQPTGAEADATWIKTRDGTKTGSGSFYAVLRDFGRLGILLANDGAAGGRQIVPKEYLLDATDWHRQPDAFTPRKATPYFGYGYQFWLFPGERRRFALLGVYGQSIFVDPELRLVMVITAAGKNASVGKESIARERDALWRGIVGQYGSW